MNLTVLGATGRTGVPLVRGVLERGHRVTCLVRDRAKARRRLYDSANAAPPAGGRCHRSRCDRACGCRRRAGPRRDRSGQGAPKDLRGQVVRHLLAAMQRHGVKRLTFLTGAGVRVEGYEPDLADRAIRGVMSLLQGEILEDGQAAVAAVTSAPLDWTVVRASRLTDAEPRGTLRIASHVGGGTGTTLGRGDLAAFLLDEPETGTWSGPAPVISW